MLNQMFVIGKPFIVNDHLLTSLRVLHIDNMIAFIVKALPENKSAKRKRFQSIRYITIFRSKR